MLNDFDEIGGIHENQFVEAFHLMRAIDVQDLEEIIERVELLDLINA